MADTPTGEQARKIVDRIGRALFTVGELTGGRGPALMAPKFMQHLQLLRQEYARPMVVTSCARSAEYNRQVGGHPRSLHVCDIPWHPTGGCCAIDIAMPTSNRDKADLVRAALNLGWSVGHNPGKGFLHFDRRFDFGVSDRPENFYY